MAHGTPASATTAVAPRKPLATKVNSMHAAYHPSPKVQQFLGVVRASNHLPTGPTRSGRERYDVARVVRNGIRLPAASETSEYRSSANEPERVASSAEGSGAPVGNEAYSSSAT